MTYTEEQRGGDAEIAAAMGWRNIQDGIGLPPLGSTVNGVFVDEEYAWMCPIPQFHADHAARYNLLVWLGADNDRWYRYVEILLSDVTQPSAMRQIATAPAHEVAEAALKVIKEME